MVRDFIIWYDGDIFLHENEMVNTPSDMGYVFV